MRTMLLFLIVSATLRGDFDAGLKAYQAHDYATAMQNWRPLAEDGAPHAEYNLGLMFAHGYGVPQDSAKAAGWYRKAAEQGVVEAQFNLGLLYAQGEGVPKDLDTARKWFQKAAEKGDPRAAQVLANLYSDAAVAENSPEHGEAGSEAKKWYEKAAAAGIPSAQFELGVIYDLGRGVPSNFAEAEKWYRQAAEKGYGPALTNIGVLFYNGQGEKRDLVLAHEYFLLGQMRGDPRASNLIECTTNKLSKKQMQRASDLAQQWTAAHQQEPAEVAKSGAQ